jgi:hypothetical protein
VNPQPEIASRSIMVSRPARRISDPDPFGDVTLVPVSSDGLGEMRLAREMADALVDKHPRTASQALKQLRQTFPGSPLTARVAALNALMRR